MPIGIDDTVVTSMTCGEDAKDLSRDDFTLSFTSLSRAQELGRTLSMVEGFPNIQVILNGADIEMYQPVIRDFEHRVRFIINKKNLGVAAAWNQGIICSNTRYVVLSSDDLEYPPHWFDPLLETMNKASAPLQASLSHPMSFSCFCIDKKLIALQGWFDHNFTVAYYEDEDWYLRFRERLGLYNDPVPYDEIIPRLKTVIRHPHEHASWNPVPNPVYFHWKWQRRPKFDGSCLHSRQHHPYKRRLREPNWPLMAEPRRAYEHGDFSERHWVYSLSRWEMRVLTRMTSNHLGPALRKLVSSLKELRKQEEK